MNRVSITVSDPDGKILYQVDTPLVIDDEGGFWPSTNFNPIMEEAIKFKTVDEVIAQWITETNPFGAIKVWFRRQNDS